MKARLKNPRKRANPAKSKDVALIARKGSAVKAKPKKRPAAPRRNPVKSTGTAKLGYIVQEKFGATWRTVSRTDTEKLAKWVAEHIAKHSPDASIRVMKE